MRLSSVLLLAAALAGCGGPGPLADDDSGPDGGATSDGAPPAHVGGWRMRGGDGSLAYHGAAPGPGAAAAMTVAYANPSTDEFAGLGSPLVDEDGNVYLVSTTPMQPSTLLSLGPTGAMRWHVPLDASTSYGELALGPDGDVYAVATTGSGTTASARIVAFDGKTGTARTGSAPIEGLARILLPADGSIYALTYTEAAGYGLQAYTGMGAAPRWTKPQGGDAYAISPAGDALAMIVVGAGTPAPPLSIVSLDPATGAERWHHTLDAQLTASPTIAIDHDGTTYVAVSQNGSNLHLIRLSSAGVVLSDLVADSLTYPSRILIGATTVSVSCQTPNYYGAGFTVEKATNDLPASWAAPCGEPEAIDANETITGAAMAASRPRTPPVRPSAAGPATTRSRSCSRRTRRRTRCRRRTSRITSCSGSGRSDKLDTRTTCRPRRIRYSEVGALIAAPPGREADRRAASRMRATRIG